MGHGEISSCERAHISTGKWGVNSAQESKAFGIAEHYKQIMQHKKSCEQAFFAGLLSNLQLLAELGKSQFAKAFSQ